ncbi:hypothetical protein D9599_27920 [Roseomonas sp. KE2513]|nr:hypothetical protein [Roseomonas sp. KE2513]
MLVHEARDVSLTPEIWVLTQGFMGFWCYRLATEFIGSFQVFLDGYETRQGERLRSPWRQHCIQDGPYGP